MKEEICTSPLSHLVGLYADGRLPETQRQEVEEHLVQCEICREHLALLLKIKTIGETPGEQDGE